MHLNILQMLLDIKVSKYVFSYNFLKIVEFIDVFICAYNLEKLFFIDI